MGMVMVSMSWLYFCVLVANRFDGLRVNGQSEARIWL